MALINKTGIVDAGLIQAEHVTRAIDALSGGSTDTIIATGSFSGSLDGTASFAVSSSFATTASFALNAGSGGGGDTATLTFFHSEVTNTTNNQQSYIGGFPNPPSLTPSRIGIASPISGTIISGSINTHASNPAAAGVVVGISVDGGSTYTDITNTMDLSTFIDKRIISPNIVVNAGDTINIRLTEVNDSAAVWSVNAMLMIKAS